ncbi:major facilitator superfamily domain-containing protein [Aspergillus filifer]
MTKQPGSVIQSQDTPPGPEEPRRSFRSFIWDTDTHLKTPEKQRLLLKLDVSMLTIGCFGFFMKYLDQGNLSNAYVSGMQGEFSMYGNEYTYAQTMYTVAYAMMQIQRVIQSIWLARMEVSWSAFTFAQAGSHDVPELYAFRFLVGFFESSFFLSLLYLLGSWYTKVELAKRVALFHMTAPLGTAFGGYLQAAVYENLNGVRGIDGRRWLYIVCGCMAVPRERDLAKERVKRAGKAPPVSTTVKRFKHILDTWKWCAFVIGYVVSCVVLWGFLSDYTGSRFAWILIPLAIYQHEICADDNEQRAVVISSMNGFQYAVAAWLPIVIFPQTMAPSFQYGLPATFGLVIAAIISVIVIQLFVMRDERRAKRLVASGSVGV